MNENQPGGTLPDRAAENLLPLWVCAVAWTAASVYIAPPLVVVALRSHEPAGFLALAFPAVGLGLLLWALRRSLRIWKFGPSTLRLGPIPAMPGGDLAATIHVDRPIPGDPPMRLRLRCVQRRSTGGRRGSTTETVLWQDLQNLDHVPPNLNGTEILVRFQIPADAQATTGFAWGREILWRLEARGKSGFVNYFARFEVPVGVGSAPEAAPEPLAPAPPRRAASPDDPRAQLREPGVVCQPLDGGGLHIHLAAARRKPIVPTIVGLLLTGIAVALFLVSVPGVMRIITFAMGSVVLLPGALFDYIAVFVWLVSQDVKVRRGSLAMERRALFFHRGRTFALREIAAITCQEDGSSSSGGSPVVKTYHGIQLKARDGKTTWLANEISNSDYAAWLTDKINDALGPSPGG